MQGVESPFTKINSLKKLQELSSAKPTRGFKKSDMRILESDNMVIIRKQADRNEKLDPVFNNHTINHKIKNFDSYGNSSHYNSINLKNDGNFNEEYTDSPSQKLRVRAQMAIHYKNRSLYSDKKYKKHIS